MTEFKPYEVEVRRLAQCVRTGASLYVACADSNYVNNPRHVADCLRHTGYPEEFGILTDDELDGPEMMATVESACFFSLVCDVREELEASTPIRELFL